MATPSLLDLEALLAPIPGDNPAGVFLRYAGDYDEINGLRPKADRDAFEGGGQAGQWPQIEKACIRKLREKSKDLSIASWLTEALVHQRGFPGMRDGIKLIHGLLERYWDTVYPLPDEDGLDVRGAPLQSLFERNAGIWLTETPLTKAGIPSEDGGDPIPVTYNLWQAIVINRSADHVHLQGGMEKATADSPNDFYLNLHADVEETEAALDELKALMAQQFGDAAPGVTTVADALRNCKGRAATVLKSRGVSIGAVDEAAGENGDAADNHSDSGGSSVGGGALRTREDAARRLREVAEFFRRTEPHSPVPYLIQRAISWSQMSFEQLLGELVKDEGSRQAINSTLGIRDDGGSAYSASGNGESAE
jgi:type VI secretion system protein ImpA